MAKPREVMAKVMEWTRGHRVAACLAVLHVLVDTAAGALLGGVIAFGPLDAGNTFLVPLAAVAASLIAASLRIRLKLLAIFGQPATARRQARWLNGTQLVIAVTILVLSMVQLYQAGLISLPGTSRQPGFERLSQAIAAHYPYFDLKGVDWHKIHDRYARQVAAAQDDAQYFTLIRNFLAELQDSHTGLLKPYPFNDLRWMGLVREIDGQAVVTKVRSTVHIPGLEPGTVLLSRDGLSIPEYISRLEPFERSGSTPWAARQNAFSRLLALPPDQTITITYRTPAGKVRSANLKWREEYAPPGPAVDQPLITCRRLSSGLGLISIPTLAPEGQHDLVREFDACLDRLFDAPGIILDLRQNGGGNSQFGDLIAGRFLSHPFTYGTETYRHRLPIRGWVSHFHYQVSPRGKTYTGPIAILIDTPTMSSAEWLVAALKDSGRAATVGRPTAGATGNPILIKLPGGGEARFSTGDFRRPDGRRIEGQGISPDLPVKLTAQDLALGRGSDLAAAEKYLLAQLQK